jgi:hypothetical protein
MSSKKPKFEMLQSMASVVEGETPDKVLYLYLKGWNLPADFEKGIRQEIDEWYEEDGLTVEFLKKEQEAFTCARYFEGRDAREEGHQFWIEFHNEWKRGRGKCTCYTVKVHHAN